MYPSSVLPSILLPFSKPLLAYADNLGGLELFGKFLLSNYLFMSFGLSSLFFTIVLYQQRFSRKAYIDAFLFADSLQLLGLVTPSYTMREHIEPVTLRIDTWAMDAYFSLC